MPRVWTHGVWAVKGGREDAFVPAWTELIPIAARLGANEPVLLRDRDRPNVFHSFGSWPALAAIERFRAEITTSVGEMREQLESFEPLTLDEVYPGD